MAFVTPYLDVPDFFVESYADGLGELCAEAARLQPPRADEFTKQAAAIHEASHCVVAAREGETLKSAKIWRTDGHWLGEFLTEGETQPVDLISEPHRVLSHLRKILAGRRGELLFARDFCLRAGLEELAYAELMVMSVFEGLGLDPHANYAEVWGTTLAEVDETLCVHKKVVLDIAGQLERREALRSRQLAKAVAGVIKREGPPPIRKAAELTGLAHDPLA